MPIRESDLILVCLVPFPRDLEIARLLGWYRIPLRKAPKVVAVDHLAFYQPGSFGEAGGRIEYTALVRGHELTTRAELFKDEAEHPRAREEYYRIQIGNLEPLAQPILAEKWRRVTFLYSTGEYLLHAHTLNDLVVQDDERALLWRALRERAQGVETYQAAVPDIQVPPEVLPFLLGFREAEAGYDSTELD
ncbi:MAG TPA: hypothetical protein VFH29_06015 [Anaerolineales bacterium]|nr:hypothetical protein [Anaerolineales bacterium]